MARGSALLTVDLDAIVENWRKISAKVAPAQAAGVVKADAYGLGAVRVSLALEQAGCRHFFVAHLIEALALKPHLSADCRIYILNGLHRGEEAECADAGVIPVLNSLQQLDDWSALGQRRGCELRAVLQLDSGMTRVGLSAEDVAEVTSNPSRLAGVELCLIISHLACGDDVDSPANARQRVVFAELAAQFPGIPRALDNSAGSLHMGVGHQDLVRPGIALYGGAPLNRGDNVMRPVVQLETPIMQIRDVPAGTGVGYGLSFVTKRPTRLAVIGVGYADGWPRHLSNVGSAYIAGHRVPIAGRVSMDSIILDVTDVPLSQLYLGATVELLGLHQTIDDVARDAGTISYEILTQLGPRYTREYKLMADAPSRSE